MQKSVRINKDTYNQLDHLRNALYPFPISFPKIIQNATENLNRQVIVVPDRDAPGEKLINQAIEFGWSVAFPEWDEKVEDVADAVLKYGRLFTMQSILKSTEKNKLKIDLKRKMYG